MGVRTRRQATDRGDRNETNIGLLAFKIAVNEGLTVYNLVDGIVDEFNDESGVSTPQNSNATYCATCDHYSNGQCLAAVNTVFGFDEGPSSQFVDGDNQTYTASRDGTAEILLWGAGGGSGGNNHNDNGSGTYGGAGGFTRVEVPVLESDALTVAVGAYGRASACEKNDGGGFSGVFTGYTPSPQNYGNSGYPAPGAIAMAGGGGGGRHSAGAGGGTSGEPGTGVFPGSAGSFGNGNAAGGSQSAGGANSPGVSSLETDPRAFYGGGWQGLGSYYLGGGGTAPQAPSGFSAGGGGGYYGGGAGQGGDNSGGGGGSGYIGGTPEHPVSKAVTITGAGNVAAYTSLAGTPGSLNAPTPAYPQFVATTSDFEYTYSPDVPSGSGMPTTFDAANDALTAHPQYPSIPNDNPQSAGVGLSIPKSANGATDVGGGTGGAVINLLASSTLSSTTTLTSAPFGTADSTVPTTSRIVVFAEIGAETLNTDFIAKISRDNGSTYTSVTLVDGGFVAGTTGQKIYTGSVDVSGQPSGNEMRYQIAGANLTESIKIHGVALQWT